MEIVAATAVTLHAARATVLRFRRGHIPTAVGTDLAPKTGKNVHRMLHRAFTDAVAWGYLVSTPAEHASLLREQRRMSRNRRGHGRSTISPRGFGSRSPTGSRADAGERLVTNLVTNKPKRPSG
jgi:hypothetical protein